VRDGERVDIERLMVLSRIEFSEDEKKNIAESLAEILDYFRDLTEVDVDGVEESAHAYPIYNVLRDDVAGPVLSVTDALSNAPEERDDQFVVPKIIE
jgi:aspartyl-tRNA(Asn)/glutamyl-tRNA(Gln) amidotransferase subunit C